MELSVVIHDLFDLISSVKLISRFELCLGIKATKDILLLIEIVISKIKISIHTCTNNHFLPDICIVYPALIGNTSHPVIISCNPVK